MLYASFPHPRIINKIFKFYALLMDAYKDEFIERDI